MERMNDLQGGDLDWVVACKKRDSRLAKTKKVIQESEWHYQKNKVVDRSIQYGVSSVPWQQFCSTVRKGRLLSVHSHIA